MDVFILMGQERGEAFADSIEPLGMDSSPLAGWEDDEITQDALDAKTCQRWQRYQDRLEAEWRAGLFVPVNENPDVSKFLGGNKVGQGQAPFSPLPPPEGQK